MRASERPVSFFEFVENFCTVLDARQRRPVPMTLYPAQVQFARELFETVDPATGFRRYRRALWSGPKKIGKSAFVGALADYELVFGRDPDRQIFLVAWDMDQTEHVFEAAAGFIQRSPVLRDQVKVGRVEMTFRDEMGRHTLRRIAHDDLGSHGGNPSMVIVDEAWNQRDWSMIEALSFSPLRPEPLMLFTGYAGYESDMVPGRPLYDLWLKLQPDAPDDPSFLGYWMTGAEARREVPWWSEEWIDEQARLLEHEPGAFRRLVENEWAQAAKGLFTSAQVQQLVCNSLRAAPGGRAHSYRTFLDIGWSRDHTAAVTVHREKDGLVIVDHVFHLVGTKEAPIEYERVEEALFDLHRRFKVQIVADQWGARQLIQRLKARGVNIRETTVNATYHDRIARTLIDLAGHGLLKTYPHPALVQQLGTVVLKRALASSRDDSSARVRIDSGAGAGVAGKDDLVVALAGAAYEVTTGSTGPLIGVVKVPWNDRAPSMALQELRMAKRRLTPVQQLRNEILNASGDPSARR